MLLKQEGLIKEFIIDNMMNWHYSGFSVYCGKTIWLDDEEGLENLASYIIRASFSSERMMYKTKSSKTLFLSQKISFYDQKNTLF